MNKETHVVKDNVELYAAYSDAYHLLLRVLGLNHLGVALLKREMEFVMDQILEQVNG
jgi:hypothetical protein